MPGRRIMTVVILAALLAACGETPPGPREVEPVETPDPVENLPEGWRWESFGGVQVGVPGDWGWGNAAQRTGQWCITTPEEREKPIVGRPAGTTLVGCPAAEPGEPDPGTLLANTGPIVDLAWVVGERPGVTRTGDRTTVVLGDVAVAVQAEPELREQIAATVHEVQGERDVYDCPTTDPVWTDPGRRPEEPVDVTTLSGVTAVSVCRYAVADPAARVPGERKPLLSSRRLTGPGAQDVVTAIAQAPPGGGPDNPGDCLPDYSYGDDLMVLHVTSAQGVSTIHVRYSGCDHNGFDDGVTVRRLTREAVQPLLAGPNQLSSFSGREEKRRILLP